MTPPVLVDFERRLGQRAEAPGAVGHLVVGAEASALGVVLVRVGAVHDEVRGVALHSKDAVEIEDRLCCRAAEEATRRRPSHRLLVKVLGQPPVGAYDSLHERRDLVGLLPDRDRLAEHMKFGPIGQLLWAQWERDALGIGQGGHTSRT